MNIRRYFGRTNRDALAALRRELGPEAVVLRNQAVEGGVELLAMAADALPLPEARAVRTASPRAAAASAPAAPAAPAAAAEPTARASQPQSAPPPEMSTLTFQQYVRERLARRAAATQDAGPETGHAAAAQRMPAAVRQPQDETPAAPAVQAAGEAVAFDEAPSPGRVPAHASMAGADDGGAALSDPSGIDPFAQLAAAESVARTVAAASAVRAAGAATAGVRAELRELRGFIAEQLGALAWFDVARQSAPKAQLVAWLLRAGFSPALVRVLLARIPSEWSAEQSRAWVHRALAHNLVCEPAESPLERGGVYALVGPTGVGKTTTTAKLAARFALVHGVQSVGLITVDAYRIGGRDQLRSFGLMLGVPVHVAHDAATLADLLRLFRGKKLVLIDTAGLGQRDQRVDKLLGALSAPEVRKLVVLNATAQVETLDDVACAYRAQAAAGVVITKVDEAARLGGVLDCALRHRLRLVGVADGQRVPEDWSAPQAQALVNRALAVPSAPAFDLRRTESDVLMSEAEASAAPQGTHV